MLVGAADHGGTEHEPLSDTPDPTSLGNAGRWGVMFVSTSEGLARLPRDPNAVIPGTTSGELSPLTTQARPPVTLFGTRADWGFGQTFGPQTGRALVGWTSGPNLPVEPWNMAIEPAAEGGGEGHASPQGHKTN